MIGKPLVQQAVGLGEIKTGKGAGVIVAYGLGSCVATAAYDRVTKVGGMVHVMLPEPGARDHSEMPGRYAGPGIESMLNQLAAQGADLRRLEVAIGGGAHMLVAPGLSDKFNIGARNVEMVMKTLKGKGLRLRGSSTGGHSGRTVALDLATGSITVKKVGDKQPTEI